MNGVEVAASVARVGRRKIGFLELTKPRLNLLVLATTLAGYYVGSGAGTPVGQLVLALAGTALVAGGASALNQWMEREADGRMHRTRDRPLPSGRLQPVEAQVFGWALVAVGLMTLITTVNALTAALAAGTCVAYLGLYTPLKRLTPFNTLVGAVPGAIPPVMGWTAARGRLGPEALALFVILFLWQVPHFLSIAWLYRDDYARAGSRVLSLEERGAERTAFAVVLYAMLLVPAVLLPTALGMAGRAYLAGSLALAVGYLATAIQMAVRCDERSARRLFRSSLIFLPLLFSLMALDKVLR